MQNISLAKVNNGTEFSIRSFEENILILNNRIFKNVYLHFLFLSPKWISKESYIQKLSIKVLDYNDKIIS